MDKIIVYALEESDSFLKSFPDLRVTFNLKPEEMGSQVVTYGDRPFSSGAPIGFSASLPLSHLPGNLHEDNKYNFLCNSHFYSYPARNR